MGNGRMEVFVVFRDISCATNALRGLQGFKLMGRELRIAFAKTKSDILALEDGTYKPRIKLKRDEEKKPTNVVRQKTTQNLSMPRSSSSTQRFAPPPGSGPSGGSGEQASNVLFVENLPSEVKNEKGLEMLFRQYPGFQEARLLVKGKNVAFIEYADELQAGIAKHGLQGYMVTPDMALKISFA